MVNTLAVDNEAKQTIEALKSELQKTKEKLQAVEELKTPSGMRYYLRFGDIASVDPSSLSN